MISSSSFIVLATNYSIFVCLQTTIRELKNKTKQNPISVVVVAMLEVVVVDDKDTKVSSRTRLGRLGQLHHVMYQHQCTSVFLRHLPILPNFTLTISSHVSQQQHTTPISILQNCKTQRNVYTKILQVLIFSIFFLPTCFFY